MSEIDDEFKEELSELTFLSPQQIEIIALIQKGYDYDEIIEMLDGPSHPGVLSKQVTRARRKRTRARNTLRFLRADYDLEELERKP